METFLPWTHHIVLRDDDIKLWRYHALHRNPIILEIVLDSDKTT